MNKKIFYFDGYKFRQAMKTTTPVTATYGSDWELMRELRLQVAENDTARMWRHIWQKMATALKSR